MIKQNKPHCDECGAELVARTDEEMENSDDAHGFPWRIARAHLCDPCWSTWWDRIWKDRDPCGECRTRPCERGECWFEPSSPWPYETYFAEKAT